MTCIQGVNTVKRIILGLMLSFLSINLLGCHTTSVETEAAAKQPAPQAKADIRTHDDSDIKIAKNSSKDIHVAGRDTTMHSRILAAGSYIAGAIGGA